MSKGPAQSPGLLRRVAAGAWNLPAGLVFLVRRPRLWPLATLPAVLAFGLTAGGFVLGLYSSPGIEAFLLRRLGLDAFGDAVSFAATLALWIGTTGACVFGGLALALLMSAPVLDLLSKAVEKANSGQASAAGGGLHWEVAQSLRGALYFLARAPGLFLVGLVPIVGPVLSALWAAHALSFQSTEASLARRGMTFSARRDWHKRFRAESLGLGVTGLVTLLIPCGGFLLAPAFVTGGTLLVAELAELEDAPPVTNRNGEEVV